MRRFPGAVVGPNGRARAVSKTFVFETPVKGGGSGPVSVMRRRSLDRRRNTSPVLWRELERSGPGLSLGFRRAIGRSDVPLSDGQVRRPNSQADSLAL